VFCVGPSLKIDWPGQIENVSAKMHLTSQPNRPGTPVSPPLAIDWQEPVLKFIVLSKRAIYQAAIVGGSRSRRDWCLYQGRGVRRV